MEMLLNNNTGVISVEGDVVVENYESTLYTKVNVEEVAVEGGFKLVGKTEFGKDIEAFLTEEEYFNGKNFTLKVEQSEDFDSRSLGEKVVEILEKDEDAKRLISITKQTMIEKGYEVNGEDWKEVMQTMMMLCIKNNDEAFTAFAKHMYHTLRQK